MSQKWIFVSLFEYDVILLSSFKLKEEKKKVAARAEKEQVQVSRDLVGDRMKWLEEEKKKAEALPEKEQVQVSRDLTEDRKKRLEE
jgi:hypothetical protein